MFVYFQIIWLELIDDSQKVRVDRIGADEVCLIGSSLKSQLSVLLIAGVFCRR